MSPKRHVRVQKECICLPFVASHSVAVILHVCVCEGLCVASVSLSKSPSATQGDTALGLGPLAFHFTSLSSTPSTFCVACAPTPSSLQLSLHMYFPLCPLLSSFLSLILLCAFSPFCSFQIHFTFLWTPLFTTKCKAHNKKLNITIFVAIAGWP